MSGEKQGDAKALMAAIRAGAARLAQRVTSRARKQATENAAREDWYIVTSSYEYSAAEESDNTQADILEVEEGR